MFFDSHAHYYDDRFFSGEGEDVHKLLDRLFRESVSGIVNVGTNAKTSRIALEMARRYPRMYAAVGLHPNDAQEEQDIDKALLAIDSLLKADDKKVVAIGEIGLDYHYEGTQRETQKAVFRRQLDMARETGYPFIVHDRDAHGDMMEILREYRGLPGVMHSYSGSLEMAEECIRNGMMISFSGTVTFKNAHRISTIAARLPRDRVLIETDCPYLAPHPLRGTRNHSGNLVYTNACLAELWGIDPEKCAAITEENARRFFRIKTQ